MEQFPATLLKEVLASCEVLLITPPPMKSRAWVNNLATLEESQRLADCYEVLMHRMDICFADAGTWSVELIFNGIYFSESEHWGFAAGMWSTLKSFFSL